VNVSAAFIRRPVATSLLTVALALAGIIAFRLLPVSPLPEVDFPTVSVQAGLPGASPETMASSVATPLERQFSRIASVTEMTSTSSLGSTNITLQFDLNRNIDAAARDVQAAINAAQGYLPANLPMNPRYRKVNPADAPILIIAMTSDILNRAQMYDVGSSILAQKLSQVSGVGQVTVGGSSLPAVRVELNPEVVNKYGIGLDQVRTVLGGANAIRPKGELADHSRAWQLSTTDQLLKASQYMPLIVAYNHGAPVRLSDLGQVVDSVEDLRNAGLSNAKPAVLLVIFRQPGANIIDTVDRVLKMMPVFQASIPPAIHLNIAMDRTTTIRASIHDVEVTLIISIGLVIMVVFVFLRNGWATVIPSVAVPLSLLGTFGVMYLAGYTLDNLSLMALTISTGFVVDDAIVVIENIARHLEKGMHPFEAALLGSREIGFTVMSMSISLVAVFIPILMMGGIVGRLFREFAIVLSVAIAVSLVVSLTTTPMLSARFLVHNPDQQHGRLYNLTERFFQWINRSYAFLLRGVLRHPALMLLVLLGTVALNVYLFAILPKGFFPEQDTGRLMGMMMADQRTSFQSMRDKVTTFVNAVISDPAVSNAVAFTGGSSTNTGRMFVALKDLKVRKIGVDEVIARLRRKTANVPGATLYLQPVQDIRVGGRMTNAQYQYTLQSQNLQSLNAWAPRLMNKLRSVPGLLDVNLDQQDRGLEAFLKIDRDTASRLGMSALDVDQALYDAFGQRQVSTMYTPLNQYHVVMEVAPEYWQNPDILKSIYVHVPTAATTVSAINGPNVTTGTTGPNGPSGPNGSVALNAASGANLPAAQSSGALPFHSPTVVNNSGGTGGTAIPLAAFTRFEPSNTPLAVNHQGQFPSVTVSFNLRHDMSLGQAVDAIARVSEEIGLPADVQGQFSGTAEVFQASLANEPVLILTALIAVYIVLGVLYESYVHPITILSTLPSAGVGALLALLITRTELTVIALIGIILLIGIVKKNAIMMIDFALDAERRLGMSSRDAIYEACLLRFRPITMTTMAALLGGLPLALGTGTGAELRRPLGITIVGGLIVSQMVTLFSTPVVYLYLDRIQLWVEHHRTRVLARRPSPIVGSTD
jgi:multidrug efflux pump